jgi:hypothetical protein
MPQIGELEFECFESMAEPLIMAACFIEQKKYEERL